MIKQHTTCPQCGGTMDYMPPTQYRDRKIFTTYKCCNCGHFFRTEESLC